MGGGKSLHNKVGRCDGNWTHWGVVCSVSHVGNRGGETARDGAKKRKQLDSLGRGTGNPRRRGGGGVEGGARRCWDWSWEKKGPRTACRPG